MDGKAAARGRAAVAFSGPSGGKGDSSGTYRVNVNVDVTVVPDMGHQDPEQRPIPPGEFETGGRRPDRERRSGALDLQQVPSAYRQVH